MLCVATSTTRSTWPVLRTTLVSSDRTSRCVSAGFGLLFGSAECVRVSSDRCLLPGSTPEILSLTLSDGSPVLSSIAPPPVTCLPYFSPIVCISYVRFPFPSYLACSVQQTVRGGPSRIVLCAQYALQSSICSIVPVPCVSRFSRDICFFLRARHPSRKSVLIVINGNTFF